MVKTNMLKLYLPARYVKGFIKNNKKLKEWSRRSLMIIVLLRRMRLSGILVREDVLRLMGFLLDSLEIKKRLRLRDWLRVFRAFELIISYRLRLVEV